MNTRDIIRWLSACPALEGEALTPDYLPAHRGWSLSADGQTVRTDILGRRSAVRKLKITRRITVADSEARLAALEQLEDFAEWAEANPPPGGTVRLTGLPEYRSRASSGTEDLTVVILLESDL